MVIVVDDDPSLREALSSLLRSVGLRVELFGSAPELLQTKLPDVASCLVLDIRLPKRSGLDFQAELAKANIEIPIIFITGHGDVPMSVRAMKAGAVDFLIKPFRDQDLLDAVAIALERDRKRREESKGREELKGLFEKLTPREKQVMALGHHRAHEQADCRRDGRDRDHGENSSRPRHAQDEREVARRARAHGRGARPASGRIGVGLKLRSKPKYVFTISCAGAICCWCGAFWLVSRQQGQDRCSRPRLSPSSTTTSRFAWRRRACYGPSATGRTLSRPPTSSLSSPHIGEAACLIVDVQMPKTSGIELKHMLRAKGIATPIIFITAFPEERVRAKALDDVSSCMLSKPFDSRVLIECLATALGKTGA